MVNHLVRLYVGAAEAANIPSDAIYEALKRVPGLGNDLDKILEGVGLQYIATDKDSITKQVETCVTEYLKEYETEVTDDNGNIGYVSLLPVPKSATPFFDTEDLSCVLSSQEPEAVLEATLRRYAKDYAACHYQNVHKRILSWLRERLGCQCVPGWISDCANNCLRQRLDVKFPLDQVLDNIRVRMNIFVHRNGSRFSQEHNALSFIDRRISKDALLMLLSSQGKTVEEVKSSFHRPMYQEKEVFLRSLRTSLLGAPDSAALAGANPTLVFLTDMSLRDAITVSRARDGYIHLRENTSCGIYCTERNLGNLDIVLEKPIRVPRQNVSLIPDGCYNTKSLVSTLELPCEYWQPTFVCLTGGEK